ncbi:MFS transporter [Spongorhabdus nitratireducens]
MREFVYRLSNSQRLGVMHGLSDGVAGFLVGSWALTLHPATLAIVVLCYNMLAFAMQPFLAGCPERWYHRGIQLSMCLAAVALLLPIEWFWLAVILSGCGSGIFHVFAGAVSLRAAKGCSAQVGWFVAPGVLGLMTGMAGGLAGWSFMPVIIIPLLLFMALVLPSPTSFTDKPRQPGQTTEQEGSVAFWLACAVLFIIAFRSLVWVFYQGSLGSLSTQALMIIAVSAAAGKLLGGWLGKVYHWQYTVVSSLLLATFAFYLSGTYQSFAWLVLGLASLQASTPSLLVRLDAFLNSHALSAALGLGTAIALGGAGIWVFVQIPMDLELWVWTVPAVLALILLSMGKTRLTREVSK